MLEKIKLINDCYLLITVNEDIWIDEEIVNQVRGSEDCYPLKNYENEASTFQDSSNENNMDFNFFTSSMNILNDLEFTSL